MIQSIEENYHKILQRQLKLKTEVPKERHLSPEKKNKLLMSLDQYNI